MVEVHGYQSCRALYEALTGMFPGMLKIDSPQYGQDAFGWSVAANPRYLFSVSTYAGQLPSGTFDLQVSICDASEENGEIVFGLDSPPLTTEEVCVVVLQYCG